MREYDVIVLGAGAAGMTAAFVAAREGARVLLVEKTPFVGGTTAKSGGVIWVPNNRFMAQAGVADSADAGIAYLDAVCEDLPGSSHEKRLAYVQEAPKMMNKFFFSAAALAIMRQGQRLRQETTMRLTQHLLRRM